LLGRFAAHVGRSGAAIGVININTLEGAEENPWADIGESLRCTRAGEAVIVEEKIYLKHHRPSAPGRAGNPKPFAHLLDIAKPTWISGHGANLCGYADDVAYFAQRLREGHAPEQGADRWDGAKSPELTEAIYASATNAGQRVGIPCADLTIKRLLGIV